LLVEVKKGCSYSGGNGEINGDGGFPDPAFLRDES
jgi:hypothetical protein